MKGSVSLCVALVLLAVMAGPAPAQQRAECYNCIDCENIDHPPLYWRGCEVWMSQWDIDTYFDGLGGEGWWKIFYGRGCDTQYVLRGAIGCVTIPLFTDDDFYGATCSMVGWGCCSTLPCGDHCPEAP